MEEEIEIAEEVVMQFYNIPTIIEVKKRVELLKSLYSIKGVVHVDQFNNISFNNGFVLNLSQFNQFDQKLNIWRDRNTRLFFNTSGIDEELFPKVNVIYTIDDLYEFEELGMIDFLLECKDELTKHRISLLFSEKRWKELYNICRLLKPYYQYFTPENLDLWLGTNIVSFVFKKGDFIIRNEEGLTHKIRGLYFYQTWNFLTMKITDESGFRDTLSLGELRNYYFHSHLPAMHYGEIGGLFQKDDRWEEFSDDSEEEVIMFDGKLCNGGNKNYGFVYNSLKVEYDRNLHEMIPAYLDKFLEQESLSGRPYRYIKDNQNIKSAILQFTDSQKIEIAKELLKIIEEGGEIGLFEIDSILKKFNINTVVISDEVCDKNKLASNTEEFDKYYRLILNNDSNEVTFKGKTINVHVSSDYDVEDNVARLKSLEHKNHEYTLSFIENFINYLQ